MLNNGCWKATSERLPIGLSNYTDDSVPHEFELSVVRMYIPPDRAQNSQTSKLVDSESDVTWPKFQYVRRKWIDKAVGGMNGKRCLFRHCLRGFAAGFESFLERNVTIGTRSERKWTKILDSTNFTAYAIHFIEFAKE